MAEVEIYTKPYCSYCRWAKDLLNRKGIAFTEIDVTGNSARRATMIQRAKGRMTVPQIFVGDRHIGGCDELYALEDAGKLDVLLASGQNA